MAGGAREAGRSTADRLFSILGAFCADDTSLSVGEISSRTDLPYATTYRLCNQLAEANMITKVADSQYRLGFRLFEIGMLARRQQGLQAIAAPFLTHLYDITHENIHLGILHGANIVYIEKLSGQHSVNLISESGGALRAHATGIGKAILAFLPEADAAKLLSTGLTRYTPRTINAPGQIWTQLKAIRERGYATSTEEVTRGAVSIAAPIFDRSGTRAIAGISIVAHAHKFEERRMAPLIRMAARGISAQLGEDHHHQFGVEDPS